MLLSFSGSDGSKYDVSKNGCKVIAAHIVGDAYIHARCASILM